VLSVSSAVTPGVACVRTRARLRENSGRGRAPIGPATRANAGRGGRPPAVGPGRRGAPRVGSRARSGLRPARAASPRACAQTQTQWECCGGARRRRPHRNERGCGGDSKPNREAPRPAFYGGGGALRCLPPHTQLQPGRKSQKGRAAAWSSGEWGQARGRWAAREGRHWGRGAQVWGRGPSGAARGCRSALRQQVWCLPQGGALGGAAEGMRMRQGRARRGRGRAHSPSPAGAAAAAANARRGAAPRRRPPGRAAQG
jgi:hypothetical protein